MTDWHSIPLDSLFKELNTSKHGLTQETARSRLAKYGENKLKQAKKISPITIFINQFKNFLVLLLVLAIAISIAIGHFIDAAVIGVIILVNAILGFIQEYKAERAMEALKKLSAPKAKVTRDGEFRTIPATQLVPGDIILLEQGDRIPADARLIEAINLRIDEASLTGESIPIMKDIAVIKKAKLAIGDKKNCVFMNTIVTYGRGTAMVTQTGMQSEVGHIAKLLQTTETQPTPLQNKLKDVAKTLGIAILIICGAMFAVGLLRGVDIFEMFITAIALAVAAVPEGLPAVVTITLAIGLNRMAKSKAIVRRLPVVETLGAATVICSDKTGTLTKNEMTVKEIYTNKKTYTVLGSGYEPKGEILDGKKEAKIDKNLDMLLKASILCTTANLYQDKGWKISGDPTEGALVVAAAKANLIKNKLVKEYKSLAELPFDSKRKRMSIVYATPTNKKVAYVKGAPEIILGKCVSIFEDGKVRKLSELDKKRILTKNQNMASRALRILAIAYRVMPNVKKYSIENTEKDLVFVGLEGMIDPPRMEAKKAISLCSKAGIKVIMITGDHELTARAIGKELGIVGKAVDGAELDRLKAKGLLGIVEKTAIFARVSPEHKVMIVEALKNKGHIVAMTGDGVNDAPALKKADIGVAMGIKGTDVAKEASDMILEDDNFATIVSAVREGRGIFDDIRKFILYLLSCNVGEIMAIFGASLIGLPIPLLAVQILWMNLLTDGLPALALGVEPPGDHIMERPPRDPKEHTINKQMWTNIGLVGTVMCIGVLSLFFLADPSKNLPYARTMAFSSIVMFQLFNVFNTRSDGSVFKTNFFSNKYLLLAVISSLLLQFFVVYVPFMQPLFGTVGLAAMDWVKIVGVSASIILVVEVWKLVSKLRNPQSVNTAIHSS